MARNVALFDVVKAIQVAEQEALDSLGARTALEARQKRRAAARARKVRRWDYVQRRANTGLTREQGAVTKAELDASALAPSRDDTNPERPRPSIEGKGIIAKLLKW